MNFKWDLIILENDTIIFGPFPEDYDFSQYNQNYERIKN